MWSQILACTLGAVALACSADSGSKANSNSDGSGGGGGTGSGSNGTGATGDTSSTLRGSGGGAVDDLPDGEACAEDAVGARTTQVNLVFVYDKSGSMGDDTKTEDPNYPRWQNMDLRWNPAKAALTAFFEDPGAPELYASIKFFPHPGGYDATCSLPNYEKPDVKLTSLADPAPLVSALDRTTPGGGTPTLPALMGAVEYAAQLMNTDYPGSKSIIILVTDGEPVVVDETGAERQDHCPDNSTNDIASIAAVAQAAYNRQGLDSIPTYVVGIGVSQDNMAQIAQAGGTELIYIEGNNGDETKAKLLEALQLIQDQNVPCDVEIPAPGQGEIIDFDKVNVYFVDSNDQKELFVQDTACSGPGWRYDNPAAPTKIKLCDATCTAVQQDLGGHLQVAFGCDTIIK
jgi:Mg-chelatase subunit ChlD